MRKKHFFYVRKDYTRKKKILNMQEKIMQGKHKRFNKQGTIIKGRNKLLINQEILINEER